MEVLWYDPVEIGKRFIEINPQIDWGKPLYSTPAMLKAQKAWRKRNKELVRNYHKVSKHKRRANVKQARGSYTWQEWLGRLELFNNRCAYCGNKRKYLTVDHWIPLSRGGTNYIDNIVPACKRCNRHKHVINGNEYLFDGTVQLAFAMEFRRMLNNPALCSRQLVSL